MNKITKLYYASDIHGSEVCFKKFVNAGKFYEADILILGGDITGKSIALITDKGSGHYLCNYIGKPYELSSGSELDDFVRILKNCGHSPYIALPEEISELFADSEKMEQLFTKVMTTQISKWLGFAENRLKKSGIRCLIMIGNDDLPGISDLIDQSEYIVNPEEKVIELDDYHQMISIGWSNRTPWDTPHECSEEELKVKIEKMMLSVVSPTSCVLCAHVPPYASGLDDAPQLTEDLRVKTSLGQVQFAPVGSTAVMDAILKYQFILGLHGHIHEVRAMKRIGSTLCINPGSDYSEGTLHGALVSFKKEKLFGYQLVSG